MILGLLLTLAQYCGGVSIKSGVFLGVEGDKLMYGGDQVYLSGTNTAWVKYGSDFGDNGWEHHGDVWRDELGKIGGAGGNSVRVWVHVEGDVSPLYDSDGFVLGTDNAGSLVSDLRSLLDECAKNNIFMGLVLFNGAVLRNQDTINLFWDNSKLETYLTKALTPMVEGLKDHPALGFWEIMNEAEGSFVPKQVSDDPCYDLTHLEWSRHSGNNSLTRTLGPGWSGANIPVENILHLHNWVADKIHALDSKALVTTGSWNSLASTNVVGDDPVYKKGFNHYSDTCLYKAGGREKGVMDFAQFHSYPWAGRWGSECPWSANNAADYGLDTPVLVGEFPAKEFQAGEGDELPDGATTEELVEYLYSHGFAGGFSWSFIPDDWPGHPNMEEDVLNGLRQLKGRTEHGKVDVEIN